MSGESEQLHPDLIPYLYEDAGHGPELYHPLVIKIGVYPLEYDVVNKLYLDKRAAVRKARAAHDWDKYIALHEKPYRFDTLRKCFKAGLRGHDFWRQVGEVWTESENIYQRRRLWRATWESSEPSREHVMTAEEQAAHARLGDENAVWRGTAHRSSIHGLSWTTDKDKAAWFARRFWREGPALLVTGVVRREDAFATFLGRKESEIVCREVTVTAVQEL